MQYDGQTPATQTSAVLQPPRPPGRPPTLTAIGLAPELPEPNDSSRQIAAAPAVKLATPRTAMPVDKILAVAAAAAAAVAAVSIWGKVLVTLVR